MNRGVFLKYAVIVLMAITLEMCSVAVIKSVSTGNVGMAVAMEGIAPMLNFAYYYYLMKSETPKEGMFIAMVNGVGYMIGTVIVLNWL